MHDHESSQTVAERLYEYFGAGRIDSVLALLHPDVSWELVGPEDIPYFGRYRGRSEVGRFFELLGKWCIVEEFEVTRLTPTAAGVVAEGRERGRFAGRGGDYSMRWCHVMRIDAGQIVEFTDYLDSAPMLAAWNTTGET